MQVILTIFHVIASLMLILVILLQAGKGGGLSEMFGGALRSNEKLFGTETNAFLTRATTFAAVIFIITSISLGVITTRQGRSIVDSQTLQRQLNELINKMPAAETSVPEAPPTPPQVPETPAAEVPQPPAQAPENQ